MFRQLLSTRFWIPTTLVLFSLAVLLSMCHSHSGDLNFHNDTPSPVRLVFKSSAVAEAERYGVTLPGETWHSRYCGPHHQFVYLSTREHPHFAAYQMRKLCEDSCRCDIKISYLEQHRDDMSVPWEQAQTTEQ